MSINYKFAKNFFKPLVNALWRVTVLDKEKFFEGKGVYICNHLSIMDCNAICMRLFQEKFNFVVKDDSIKGFKGKLLLFMGGIPIKRGESDLRAVKTCLKVLKNEEPLIIFPEGTRNLGFPKELLPFKDGPAVFAIKTKSPVIPLLYYRKPDIKHRNYLIVGDPVDLSEFYGMPLNEGRALATTRLEETMRALRIRLDGIVEDKRVLREYKKAAKTRAKAAKKSGQLLLK